ncbi:hypothetical protein EVAR_69324_1 [Eumeta japonica]|uniref:Uncharacterized protein n=1 Tax=Eumeta variegata TaxID=151549 RepID=A0A4C2A4H2_EUMVA|nr:hypothetical protein EVAR_69324_1 [Eumeta japonica]
MYLEGLADGLLRSLHALDAAALLAQGEPRRRPPPITPPALMSTSVLNYMKTPRLLDGRGCGDVPSAYAAAAEPRLRFLENLLVGSEHVSEFRGGINAILILNYTKRLRMAISR